MLGVFVLRKILLIFTIQFFQIDLTVENQAIDDFMIAQKKSQINSTVASHSSTARNESETAQNSSEEKDGSSSTDETVSPCRTLIVPTKHQPTVLPYLNGIASPLQPVPFSSPDKLDSSVTPSTTHKYKSSLFKLEDFETNYSQSSPFDAVELKTLNVYEELRQVLQGGGHHGQTVVVSEQQTPSSTSTSSLNGHRHVVHNFQ